MPASGHGGWALALLALVAGCAPGAGRSGSESATLPQVLAAQPPALTLGLDDGNLVTKGRAFASAHCAACHATAPGGLARNPQAPSFERVVNTPGLTEETLTVWLRSSHNYPEIMRFELEPSAVDALAAYMLTLKSATARPDP